VVLIGITLWLLAVGWLVSSFRADRRLLARARRDAAKRQMREDWAALTDADVHWLRAMGWRGQV
jgi:hypothetical protein